MTDPINLIVGTDGSMLAPMVDAETGTSPFIAIGPGFKNNLFRFIVRMPDKEAAMRLPAPAHSDRASICFEPQRLILTSNLPMNAQIGILRIETPRGHFKTKKNRSDSWRPDTNTGSFPSVPVSGDILFPSDWMVIDGWSGYHEKRAGGLSGKLNRSVNDMMLPGITMNFPIGIVMSFKCRWNVSDSRVKVSVVQGSASAYIADAVVKPDPYEAHNRNFAPRIPPNLSEMETTKEPPRPRPRWKPLLDEPLDSNSGPDYDDEED